MPTNIFVSFDHDDQEQVSGFKSLKNNPNHNLEFNDHSLKEPVKDINGNPIIYDPGDTRSKPVRDEILKRFESCSKLVVLIGENTHTSKWVDWEINSFYKMKYEISGENTWKRIRGMTLKGSDYVKFPNALVKKSVIPMKWDPDKLDEWLCQNPNS